MILKNDKSIYIEVFSYSDIKRSLREEKLRQSDIILHGSKYKNIAETRKSLLNSLKAVSNKIRNLDIVDVVNPNPSKFKDGLSVYINILFKYPEGISVEERDKYYKYIIRFSDHDDKHQKDCITSRITTTGKVVSDLSKLAIEAFNESLPEIEDRIRDFEIEKFGEQKTFLTVKNESIRLKIKESVDLNEGLDEVADGTYCTDYVGDVANWILNKPKPYRVLYDKKFDIWCIADAMKNTHKDMSIDMYDDGYVEKVGKNVDKYINFARNYGDFSSGWTDAEVYCDYGFDHGYLVGMFFIPSGDKYSKYEESGFYSKQTPIKSGTIFTRSSDDFTEYGIFKDLFVKLGRMGAFDEE
jgi:hypothetical protein